MTFPWVPRVSDAAIEEILQTKVDAVARHTALDTAEYLVYALAVEVAVRRWHAAEIRRAAAAVPTISMRKVLRILSAEPPGDVKSNKPTA